MTRGTVVVGVVDAVARIADEAAILVIWSWRRFDPPREGLAVEYRCWPTEVSDPDVVLYVHRRGCEMLGGGEDRWQSLGGPSLLQVDARLPGVPIVTIPIDDLGCPSGFVDDPAITHSSVRYALRNDPEKTFKDLTPDEIGQCYVDLEDLLVDAALTAGR